MEMNIRITKEKIQTDHYGFYEDVFFVDMVNSFDARNLASFKTEIEAIQYKNEFFHG